MRIGVIGAGIGGLATAIGLQRAGAEVRIFERRPEAEGSGSGLSLFGNARTALEHLGLGPAFDGIATPAAASLTAGQRRPDGDWLAITPPEALTALRIVHRARLHRLLRDALRPGTLQTRTAASVVSDTGILSLEGPGGTAEEHFDVVVAADGIRSRVRGAWPEDPGLRYSGYSTWRGITATPVGLDAAGETWGRRLRFGMAPLPDGRVYWFAVATMPEEARVEDEYGEVLRLFRDWHRPIPELVQATAPQDVFRLPIHDLAAPLPTFRHGRTVLLGDAAHAMTPDLGQGAGQALEDAATLTALLSGIARDAPPVPAAVDAALSRYDALRRPRTQTIARQAHTVGQVAQGQAPLPIGLRDAILRLTPAGVLGRQLRQLQTWAPPS